MTTEQLAFRQCLQLATLSFGVVDNLVWCNHRIKVPFKIVLPKNREDDVGFNFPKLIVPTAIRLN